MAATHLADTSALLQLHQPAIGSRLVGLVVAGRVATCGLVDLELLAWVPPGDRAEVLAERRFFPRVPCGDEAADRAIQVQALLGDPAPPSVQLLVAAAAELSGLVLLHADTAFARIAAATGQPVEDVSDPGLAP